MGVGGSVQVECRRVGEGRVRQKTDMCGIGKRHRGKFSTEEVLWWSSWTGVCQRVASYWEGTP